MPSKTWNDKIVDLSQLEKMKRPEKRWCRLHDSSYYSLNSKSTSISNFHGCSSRSKPWTYHSNSSNCSSCNVLSQNYVQANGENEYLQRTLRLPRALKLFNSQIDCLMRRGSNLISGVCLNAYNLKDTELTNDIITLTFSLNDLDWTKWNSNNIL